MFISNIVRTTTFWNNIDRVPSKLKEWKPNYIKSLLSKKTKGPKQGSKNRLKKSMPERGKSPFYIIITLFRNC